MQRGVLTLAAVAALWTLPAFADPVIPQGVFLTTQGEGQYLAKDLLLGAKVHNSDGKIIGDVEDLILNADNQVQGVIMGVGGFAGFGEKRVAVALPALQIKNESGVVIVSLPQATKEVLDALPAFERKQPPKSLLDRAIEKAQELSDKSSVTAKDAYEKAKQEAGPALEKASEAAKKAYEDVKQEAGPAMEKASEAAKKAYEDAKQEAGPALEKAKEATKNAYDAAKETLQQPSTTTPAATPPATTEPAPAAPPAETPKQ